jgi:hypothetical protein
MATSNKDFKVKNGIQVAGDGSFGGTLTAAAPTSDNHLTTKSYVDSLLGSLSVQVGSAPESPEEGQIYFDASSGRLAVYYNSEWVAIATVADAEELPDHIHDTSIDGNGLIVTRFYDAGTAEDTVGDYADAGTASTTSWETTWDGGTSTDNFN